jgi:hypothetical protein
MVPQREILARQDLGQSLEITQAKSNTLLQAIWDMIETNQWNFGVSSEEYNYLLISI